MIVSPELIKKEEVTEEKLMQLEEDYYRLRETYREEHPQVQYLVQEYRRLLRAYERQKDQDGDRGEVK